MFGISWGELLIAAIAALIVIGPNELPKVLRNIGQIIGKLKSIANEFSRAIEKEAEAPKKYIKDLDGNLQETYDINDLK
ncbi:MAG: twin-arginine translocase subunit TatB [Alphaproteobacteria bacterium CG11_big_fil_rev_8_21_14_0_20_44_7]|nr:MAG: twin-arginine translocase subunit TatB [Alphaproteobacteria bacterium CG11_big_fil_rev_8_21_14_0_20_44_7]